MTAGKNLDSPDKVKRQPTKTRKTPNQMNATNRLLIIPIIIKK